VQWLSAELVINLNTAKHSIPPLYPRSSHAVGQFQTNMVGGAHLDDDILRMRQTRMRSPNREFTFGFFRQVLSTKATLANPTFGLLPQ
jgi:hypothetical protein